MLTETEMERKLREHAGMFRRYVEEKNWPAAHNVYNITMEAAVMVEMPERFMHELFGGYDAEGYPLDDGLIRRSDVSKVNMECCIKRNMAYEDRICRQRGYPLGVLRHYSDEDYCAGCKKAKR